MQAQTAGATGNRVRREIGTLQHNVLGVVGHRRILAAHDTGQGQGTLAVADEQTAGLEFDVIAIQ